MLPWKSAPKLVLWTIEHKFSNKEGRRKETEIFLFNIRHKRKETEMQSRSAKSRIKALATTVGSSLTVDTTALK